jgi:beta-aspartyl-peptidase (threonine type)
MARILLGLALLMAAACNERTLSQGDRTAITAVLEQQRDAWNRGDLDAFMAGYERSDDLLFASGGKVQRGWQRTLDRYRARYGSQPGDMGALAFTEIEITDLGGSAALAVGRYTLTDTPKAGTGVFTLVFSRTPEGWRIIADHTSAAE